MTDALRPWTFDFHIAQNDGTVHGTGSHDKTGRHCRADDPNGKLDITRCAGYWLKDHEARGIKHLCWDGCMFDNAGPGHLEHHPRRHGQGPRRPRLGLIRGDPSRRSVAETEAPSPRFNQKGGEQSPPFFCLPILPTAGCLRKRIDEIGQSRESFVPLTPATDVIPIKFPFAVLHQDDTANVVEIFRSSPA